MVNFCLGFVYMEMTSKMRRLINLKTTCKKNRATSKAFKLITINRQFGFYKIHNTNYHSRKHIIYIYIISLLLTSPGHPHKYTPTPMHATHPTYTETPLLSSTSVAISK